MITEKTKKTKQNKTSKNGYDLNKISTKKATTTKSKGRGVLNIFFSLMGFALGAGSLLALFIMPTIAKAAETTYIIEPFSCEVALANYHHLTKTTKENNPQFVQEQLEISLEAVTQELAEHSECKGVSDGK